MPDETSDSPVPAEPIPLGYARDGVTIGHGAELVTVATFADSWEAHLAIGKLEAAGIPATLADENIVAAGSGVYGNLVGGVKLRVARMDVEHALAELPSRVRARIVVCPKCRSTDTRQIDFPAGTKILFLLLLGLPYLFVLKPWYCLACGQVFRPPVVADSPDDDDEDDDEGDESGDRSHRS